MAGHASIQDLYMGSSIEDLDALAVDVTLSDDVVKSWDLAEDSYVEATAKDNEGNEEAAYMLYKRYIHVVQKAQTSKEYLLNVAHYEPYFSKEQLLTAVERSDFLASSLHNRYGGITGKLKKSFSDWSQSKETISRQQSRDQSETDDGSGGLSDNDSQFNSEEDETVEVSLPEHTAIIVTDLPPVITEDAVMLYFERRRLSDGGPVEKVDLKTDGSVIVYFENAEDAARVLRKKDHKIKDADVHVSVYVPEKPIIKTENTIEVRGFNNLSDDVLEMYFENTRKSGGGDIDCLKRNEDTGVVLITFSSSKIADRVLKKESHNIKKTVLQVTAYKEEPESTEEQFDPTCTVEVRNFGTLSDDMLEMYFEDTRKSGGGDVTALERREDVIYIILENANVATRVVNREHKIKGQKLSVTPYQSQQPGDTKGPAESTVHVRGCKDLTEDLLELYFQNKRRSGGGDIRYLQRINDDAFITFENAEDAQGVLEKNHKLGPCKLTVCLDNQTEETSIEQYGELEIDSSSSGDENIDEIYVLQVADLKQISEDTISLYFENRRRSGGGEIEMIEVDKQQNSALLYFKDGDAVSRILQKSPHLLEGKTLDLKAYTRTKFKGTKAWLRGATKAKTVEVKGCMNVGNDKLQLYFENETRSGGSDVKQVKRSEENGDIVYIVFNDIKVAERVSTKSHSIGKHQLQVKLIKPMPKYDNRFLITELKETTTKDKLAEYLMKHTPCSPLGFEYGEDNSSVLVTVDTTKSPLRIKDIQKTCSQRPLEGAFLDISPVPISNCILVKGLQTDIDADHLSLYFESVKSGNNMRVRVEKVEQPVVGEALVYFENYKVIEHLLPKKHRLGSANITVSLYIECLQPGDTVFLLPSPVCLDMIDRHLVRYIRESPEKEADLRAQLQNVYAELVWVSEESAEFECALSEDIPGARKLLKAWKKSVGETFQSFIDQFLVKVDKVLDDIWDIVTPKLEGMSREHCKLFMLPGCMIAVVGPDSDVRDFREEIQDVIREAENDNKEENKEITEQVKTINPLVLRLLRDSNFSDSITDMSTRVKVRFSRDAEQIVFTGPLEEVRRAKLQTEEKAKSVPIVEVRNMSEAQMDLVEKQDVRQYILSKLAKKDLVGSWMSDKGSFKVASFSETDGHAIIHMIKQVICEQKIDLKKESISLVVTEQWSDLVAAQVRNKGNFVKIITDKEDGTVTIYATDDEIINVTEEVNNFINENTVYTDFVQYCPGVQRFLSEYEMNYIRSLRSLYKKYAVEVTEGIAKVRFNIRGTKDGLSMIRMELDKLSQQVIHREHEFNKPGIAKLLLSNKGAKVIKNVENAERCVVESNFNPQEKLQYGKPSVLQDDAEQPVIKLTSTFASGRKLIICQGDITSLEVDAIVNAANQKLAHIGGLAKAIVERGGSSIEEESNAIIKSKVELLVGDAAVTKAGNLPCEWVIHAVGPTWSGGTQGEEELLREAVFKAIEEADLREMTSVAFPALSTGIFNYPKEAATRVIIKALMDSFEENPESLIEKIYACDKNSETVNAFIQAFQSESCKIVGSPKSSTASQKRPVGGILMPAAKEISEGLATFTIGKVCLILKRGDITQEKVDCIVNCTNTELSMDKGAISKAILRAGGKALKAETATKVNEMAQNGVVTTSAGDLPSAFIVHVAVDFFDGWKNIVQNCLKAAKGNKNIKCIAFPAIGTGSYENSPEAMAKLFVEALDEYKGKYNAREVRVVILQEDVLQAFTIGVRKAVSKLKDPKSLIGRAFDYVKKKTSDPTITLHFFSDKSNHIEQAISRLEQHYMDNRLDKTITDDALKGMNKQQADEIVKLRETFSIQVEYNRRLGRVRLQGLMNDVLPGIDAVHRIIHDVHRYIQAAEKADMLSGYLQWTYIDKDSTENDYDKLSNQAIEDAYNSGDKTIQITPAGKDPVVIDFDLMMQCSHKKPDQKLPVVRRNRIKGASFDPPSTWVQMNSNSEMVKVHTDSEEYRDVEQRFFKSVGAKRNIIQIQRIQTRFLWQQYLAKKEELAVQNAGHQNENFLWHGTAADAFASIAKAGFNRSYCGKNATAYGEGVYFAASASYAVQNTYSKPDKDGHKHVFLARVLTGIYTKGKSGWRVPPTRDESNHVLYDSVVDDVNKPNMYVIFNDTQAYPDYLISFG